ncbi:hypothetical protein RHECNPAF_13300133 [Rhizobium etli CNPAF512]|nr:hypothetical protein RHECNPAF_13300133 [Rhizobium etli CNPAF512]
MSINMYHCTIRSRNRDPIYAIRKWSIVGSILL